jgi:hypothetical protein
MRNFYRFPEFGSKAVITLELVLEVGLLPLGRKVQTTDDAGNVERRGSRVGFSGVLQPIHDKL